MRDANYFFWGAIAGVIYSGIQITPWWIDLLVGVAIYVGVYAYCNWLHNRSVK